MAKETVDCCPFCGSGNLRLFVSNWEAKTEEHLEPIQTLVEHICGNCQQSFWT